MSDRFGEKVICNPKVKMHKGIEQPFISMEMISPGYKYVSAEYSVYDGKSSSKFEDGDVLMARITPCLENGKIARCRLNSKLNGFGSTEFFVFRGKEGETDTDYLYYLLSTYYFRQMAINSMTGASGRQRADIEYIKKIKWRFPDLNTQKQIAGVLRLYDDLIDINFKKIKLLEDIATDIYKEWFVRFRFPGYEDVPLSDGRLGKIPETFSICKMEEVVDYYIGGGWGNDDEDSEFNTEAYVIRGTDFSRIEDGDLTSCPLRYHKPNNYEKRKLEDDDIIIEISGGTSDQPVGRTLIVSSDVLDRFDHKVICASFCKLMRLKKDRISPIFFYYWMQFLYDTRIIDRFQVQSTGIINFKFEYFLRKGEVMIPPADIMAAFEDKVLPVRKEKDILARKNEILIEQRDMLLSKLFHKSILECQML